jgi:RNA polymerase sigma-54 factor
MVMTPQLRQAIQLLQLSNMEASQFIEEELLRNPLLERTDNTEHAESEQSPDTHPEPAPPQESTDTARLAESDTLPDAANAPLDVDMNNVYDSGTPSDGSFGYGGDGVDDWSGFDSTGDERPNLREHLEQQARLAFPEPLDLVIATGLISVLDKAGRISDPPEAIASALGIPLLRVEQVRKIMMHFDPTGMFALTLAECLEVQLAEKNRLDPAMAALLANLDLLARRETRALCEVCGVDMEDLADMISEIRRLDPKPGSQYESEPLRPLIPDVLMRPMPLKSDGVPDWIIEINPETMPKLAIRHGFYARMTTSGSHEIKSFLSEHLQNATWLVKALEARSHTILRVSAAIIQRQEGFFRHGISHLKPLTLRDISADVELHESTISRVTSNKSIATPRGIFELKFFFTTALVGTDGQMHSAESVRHRIQTIISNENPHSILSDDAVVSTLQKEGIDIARRTVAKYREALRIPGSAQRKRDKLMEFQNTR